MRQVGEVWEYRDEGRNLGVYLIIAKDAYRSYKMIDLSTGELFTKVQLPEDLRGSHWRWVT